MRDLLAGELLVASASLRLLPQRRRVAALPLLLEVLLKQLPHHGTHDVIGDPLQLVDVLVLLLIVDRREALVASIVEAPVCQLHSEPLLEGIPVHDGVPHHLLVNLVPLISGGFDTAIAALRLRIFEVFALPLLIGVKVDRILLTNRRPLARFEPELLIRVGHCPGRLSSLGSVVLHKSGISRLRSIVRQLRILVLLSHRLLISVNLLLRIDDDLFVEDPDRVHELSSGSHVIALDQIILFKISDFRLTYLIIFSGLHQLSLSVIFRVLKPVLDD